MGKRVSLPAYEQMLLNLGAMNVVELTNLLNCVKVALRQKQPRAPRKQKPVVQEKAS